MPKRRQRQDCNCGKRTRPKPGRREKHLYVILDDIENGYSIHKLEDLSRSLYESEEESDIDNDPSDPKCLPKPPALRLGLACHEKMFFAALGTNIFMANNLVYDGQPPALLYDTEAGTLNLGPRIPTNLRPSIVVAIPGDGVDGEMQRQDLYVLSSDYRGKELGMEASFQVMSWVRTIQELGPFQRSHKWSWESVPAPPTPFNLTKEAISSFVMHPDGRRIFFSMQERCNQHRDIGTYSFDIKGREWCLHGEWVLPFHNQGYYDRELDAWVGLAGDGYVCSCRVASSSGGTQGTVLDLRRTKDKLLHEVGTDARRHLGATLTYMGNSRFCIVECIVREDVELRNIIHDSEENCVLQITVFGLKYNYKGELETTSRCTTKSYAVSKNMMGFSPKAFWM
jgi:hypothetical protein